VINKYETCMPKIERSLGLSVFIFRGCGMNWVKFDTGRYERLIKDPTLINCRVLGRRIFGKNGTTPTNRH